ncbi:MAG TPA: HAD-IA family hydrolase, partial [Candidatus Polarisedimenticolaceae bacterium]|nr:HAD-IA family hydrolase [Candidatus Polarisedimenticolaceae bacterium]
GSSGPAENVALALRRLERASSFAAVVTAADVRCGKPDPEVFQRAALLLGVDARRCAVIEDAPAGIRAARAAGMAAVALVSTGRAAADFAGLAPDLLLHSLRELSPQRLGDLR